MNDYIGPWEVTGIEHGSSYALRHVVSGKIGKSHAAHLSPFPPQLIPFRPLQGPDNTYGQMNKGFEDNPYKDASIRGFAPFEPYKEAPSALNLLSSNSSDPSLHLPTLAELNAEIDDFPEFEQHAISADNDVYTSVEVFLAPPEPPVPSLIAPLPVLPSLGTLTAGILRSPHKLFFISHRIPGSSVSEWSLVSVAMEETMSLNPNALQDGKFLVDFYICHPADAYYNATNQRYWLEYHPTLQNNNPEHRSTAHLLRPSSASPAYAISEGLRPFRQWVRLTNGDTYIHGPFNFAVVNGRQTRDRIDLEHWEQLHLRASLYSNPAPSLELPSYSIHLSQPHISHSTVALTTRFNACTSSPSTHSTV